MSTVLSPIVSEFATQEEADAYDVWFRAKVQASLDDPTPSTPHDEAMARVDRLLDEKNEKISSIKNAVQIKNFKSDKSLV
jgi:hypothetical protein